MFGATLLRVSERRAQKLAQSADARAKGVQPATEDSLTDDDASAEDELDSDDGGGDGLESNRVEERRPLKAPAPTEPRFSPLSAKKHHRLVDGVDSRLGPPWPLADSTMSSAPRKVQLARSIRPRGKYETDGPSAESANKLPGRLILGLADLDSPHGRYAILSLARFVSCGFPSGCIDIFFVLHSMNFIFSSIAYLFMATYEPTDDITISSLLTYLNAAMPPDKHEDFDTAEVAKAAAALSDKGDIIFEGDTLRLPH